MTLAQLFIETALQQVGCPYIWGGKGTHLFDAQKGLVGNPYIGNEWGHEPVLVFDCSGLVTWAILKVMGEDRRATLNAQLMFDTLSNTEAGAPHLRFYGESALRISHVAIGIADVAGKVLVVEASGGDHTTTTVMEARKRGAHVRCGFERRADYVSKRALPV